MDLSKAFEQYESGNLTLASDICREIIKTQPQNTKALFLLGKISHQVGIIFQTKGQFNKAEKLYDEAIQFHQFALQIDPNLIDASDNLLELFKERNKLDQLFNNIVIHCIGDSHACFFSGKDVIHPEWPFYVGNNSLFRSYDIGPSLAYNLCKFNTTTKGREKLLAILKTIPNHAKILLIFGEIDCRMHIGKQADVKKRSLVDIVKGVVDRYFGVISEIRNMGFDIGVWGVIPSNIPKQQDFSQNNSFPAYGTFEQRNKITRLFNSYLGELCIKQNIIFVSLFEEIINPDLTPNFDYYKDPIHLSQKAMPLAL